jgi:hypothetical protein
MDRIKVKPRDGRNVPTPDGKLLPAEGIVTDDSSWWRRREAEGDVEISGADEPRRKGKE